LSEEDARSILEAVPQLERLPVLFDPRSRLRMADVRARVLSVRARQPIAFVGLDYLQLLEEDGDAESREEAISRATRECKLLAKEAGVPFGRDRAGRGQGLDDPHGGRGRGPGARGGHHRGQATQGAEGTGPRVFRQGADGVS
jgi:hypothetical protein